MSIAFSLSAVSTPTIDLPHHLNQNFPHLLQTTKLPHHRFKKHRRSPSSHSPPPSPPPPPLRARSRRIRLPHDLSPLIAPYNLLSPLLLHHHNLSSESCKKSPNVKLTALYSSFNTKVAPYSAAALKVPPARTPPLHPKAFQEPSTILRPQVAADEHARHHRDISALPSGVEG